MYDTMQLNHPDLSQVYCIILKQSRFIVKHVSVHLLTRIRRKKRGGQLINYNLYTHTIHLLLERDISRAMDVYKTTLGILPGRKARDFEVTTVNGSAIM